PPHPEPPRPGHLHRRPVRIRHQHHIGNRRHRTRGPHRAPGHHRARGRRHHHRHPAHRPVATRVRPAVPRAEPRHHLGRITTVAEPPLTPIDLDQPTPAPRRHPRRHRTHSGEHGHRTSVSTTRLRGRH